MSKDPCSDHSISSEFEIEQYFEAASDAARRTRALTVILVVACVLIGIGFYNSTPWSWSRDRLTTAFDSSKDQHKYFKGVLSKGATDADITTLIEKNQTATARAWVENVRLIRAPFFGVAFDVNDLGVIGGLSFIIILSLTRYSLSREIKNLNVSFREAVHHERLSFFYHALAMRQVFTVPEMKGETRNSWLVVPPLLIYFLPVLVFSFAIFVDIDSVSGENSSFDPENVRRQLIVECVLLLTIVFMAVRCFLRQMHINNIWEHHWKRLNGEPSMIVTLRDDMVECFGSDEKVNKLLNFYKKGAFQQKPDDLEIANLANEPIKGLKSAVIKLDVGLINQFGTDKATDKCLRALPELKNETEESE